MKDWLTKKISGNDIERLCFENQTSEKEKVLIVHCDDMPFVKYFPNHVKANTVQENSVSVLADEYYYKIYDESNKYDVVICTGLLEHVPNPAKTISEIKRVLKIGGRGVFSVSASFSTHNAPNDFFHFTVFGIKLLFEEGGWQVDRVAPSCHPFQTIAILLQRICYQTKMSRLFKGFLFFIAKLIKKFDLFIKEDFGDINKKYKMESSLYSNVQIVAIKK